MGQYWLGKTKLLNPPKILSKHCHWIFYYWLTNWCLQTSTSQQWLDFFSLFDIASAREVPFGILQYIPVSSFVCHSSLLTARSVDLVVARDGFFFAKEIIHIFYSGYFDYKGTFQTAIDSYCCVAKLNKTENKALQILHFSDNYWGTWPIVSVHDFMQWLHLWPKILT